MRKEKLGTVTVFALIIICGFIALFSLGSLGKYYLEAELNKSSNNKLTNIFKKDEPSTPTIETNPDGSPVEIDPEMLKWLKNKYDEMHNMNNDYALWLSIDSINLNYPVCRNPKDDKYFYLTHDFNKKENTNGCLFLSDSCKINSDNIIIYGHNMQSGEMFGKLNRFLNEEFAKNNRLMVIYTENDYRFYEIVSVYTTSANHPIFAWESFTKAYTPGQLVRFGNSVKGVSKYNFGYEPGVHADRFLTLVTCEYTHDNGRLVVIARELGRPKLSAADDAWWEEHNAH
jgi:sortase B